MSCLRCFTARLFLNTLNPSPELAAGRVHIAAESAAHGDVDALLLEDLDELLRLVTDCKENIPNKTTQLREAITYADMVIQYVNDGSGTPDMIRNALNRLRSTL